VPRSTLDRVMGIFNALTSVLFAYGEQGQQQQLLCLGAGILRGSSGAAQYALE
jgi:hypothetical protein